MSGLVKQKKYDWKDSNLALFGSDTEKSVKKEAAEKETAWKDAGQKVGLQIWRIVKFKVVNWPKEDYGRFYNGDSYIILNTYKDKKKDGSLAYDLHFWIGQYSTQDEYGTAAYKTVELDTFLDDKPVQHREVEGNESDLFLKYFKRMELMTGGADSGFRSVEHEKYVPRLFHVSGCGKQVTVKEVTLCRKMLKKEDAYVIDTGMNIYQWNGVNANMKEKYHAGQYIGDLRSQRGGKPDLEVLDDQEDGEVPESLEEIFNNGAEPDETNDQQNDQKSEPALKVLYVLSDAGGELKMNKVAEGSAVNNRKMQLKSEDVFILDIGKHCYVWTGNKASKSERKNALTYAHNYLKGTDHQLIPVTCLSEGEEKSEFLDLWKK